MVIAYKGWILLHQPNHQRRSGEIKLTCTLCTTHLMVCTEDIKLIMKNDQSRETILTVSSILSLYSKIIEKLHVSQKAVMVPYYSLGELSF